MTDNKKDNFFTLLDKQINPSSNSQVVIQPSHSEDYRGKMDKIKPSEDKSSKNKRR
jgi:hypothetical protein